MTSQVFCTSESTGLKVLSIRSKLPGYIFSHQDRAKLVASVSEVVILNYSKNGEVLIAGIDVDNFQFTKVLNKLEEQKNWIVSCLDTSQSDPFSYLDLM